jgi:hypothetical protein
MLDAEVFGARWRNNLYTRAHAGNKKFSGESAVQDFVFQHHVVTCLAGKTSRSTEEACYLPLVDFNRGCCLCDRLGAAR